MFFNLKSIEEVIDFMVAKKITPNQAFFCHLVYTQDWKSFYKYVHEFKTFSLPEIEDLEDRGYIFNQDRHNKTVFSDMFIVTDLLLEGLDLADTALGEEFWNTYPNFIRVNNTNVPAKSCDKDTLIKDYTRRIVASKAAHVRILGLLNFAKDQGMITMGIRKWVDSRQWEVIAEVQHSTPTGPKHGEQEF